MRARTLALTAALLMALSAGQSFLFPSTGSGNTPEATIISQTVFEDGCAGADLHVMRYLPGSATASAPVVASWCR